MNRHFTVQEHNSIRAFVYDDPVQTNAVIKEVNHRKGAHYAVFEFAVRQKRVQGKTFTAYNGMVGDSVCVTYSKVQLSQNIYCGDLENEPYNDAVVMDSVKVSAILAAFMVLVVPMVILWEFITGNRRLKAELTSRKR